MDVRKAGHFFFKSPKIRTIFQFHEMVLFHDAQQKYAFLNLNVEEGLSKDMKMRVDLKTS